MFEPVDTRADFAAAVADAAERISNMLTNALDAAVVDAMAKHHVTLHEVARRMTREAAPGWTYSGADTCLSRHVVRVDGRPVCDVGLFVSGQVFSVRTRWSEGA